MADYFEDLLAEAVAEGAWAVAELGVSWVHAHIARTSAGVVRVSLRSAKFCEVCHSRNRVTIDLYLIN